jgi:hypothetical protein
LRDLMLPPPPSSSGHHHRFERCHFPASCTDTCPICMRTLFVKDANGRWLLFDDCDLWDAYRSTLCTMRTQLSWQMCTICVGQLSSDGRRRMSNEEWWW